jgi:serine/threonine-protein kinase
MTNADTSLVGQVLLGRYRVLRRLALGGMGAVYLARTEGARGFSKPVVVKRILPIWGDDEEIASLFAREARILSQLQDPGIVSVIDFGQIGDGTLVMVLDYVHGYHLAHWLAYLRAVQGQMPVEMAVHIMLRVLSALHYAHTFVKADGKPLQVVHRDVSPTNILLDTSGNVKLVDFGIARAAGDSNEYKTEAPQLRGKFGYLAPELFVGEEPSPQSDVYAAGVVLYELLSGDNPFRGREVTDSYHKALMVVAPAADSLRADVSAELAEVVARALAKDPAQRYASASDFADALRIQRPAADELCQARLRASVQAGFAGPLADTLGIEPLSASDEVWRNAADGVQSLETAVNVPPASPISSTEKTEPSGPPGPGSPDENGHDAADSLTGNEHSADAATVRERHIDNPSTAPSPVRVRWMLAGSATLFGIALVASVVRMLEPKTDRVIVIEREPSAVGETAFAAEPSAPPVAAAVDGPAVVAKPAAAKLSASQAVSPEPALLTSIFVREQARVQRCFGAHARQADSESEILVEFRVDASGSVEKAELVPASLASGALGACLIGVAKTTRFPRLTHGVTFRIPIQARVTQP